MNYDLYVLSNLRDPNTIYRFIDACSDRGTFSNRSIEDIIPRKQVIICPIFFCMTTCLYIPIQTIEGK